MDGMMENGNDIVELVDESGETVRFEHVRTVEYEGSFYVLLAPIDDVEDVEDDEVIIFKIEGDDQDTYVGVEDEELLEKVFNRYLELAEADEEGEEAAEDEDDE